MRTVESNSGRKQGAGIDPAEVLFPDAAINSENSERAW
jgi:hypothetical protein